MLAPPAAVVAGGLLLLWPAALNGYPLVFIDTASYLMHTVEPSVPWDKTQAYGPFLHLFHWRLSLWPPMLAQGLIASHLIWLVVGRAAVGASPPTPPLPRERGGRDSRSEGSWQGEGNTRSAGSASFLFGSAPLTHLLICAALGAFTSAPWFLATLMPDAFTALAPLCLYLLAFGRLSRGEIAWVTLLGAFAIAAHLSHLPVALGLLVLTALLTRRGYPVLRAAAPIALAVTFLLTSNALAFGRATLSPHGAVFLLARLQADGPAARLLRARCPEAGWHLCAFTGHLPMDSDEFLWNGDSPLNREADGSYRAMGGMRGAAEAGEIVREAIRAYPLDVARAVLANTLRQLMLVRVGDTLSNEHLAASARRYIEGYFPARELAAFDAGAQMRGTLASSAEHMVRVQVPAILLALLIAAALLRRAVQARDSTRGALILFALAAVLGNAVVTGGLSKPHHRYQARIVWLLPLAVMSVARVPHPPRTSPAQAAKGGLSRRTALPPPSRPAPCTAPLPSSGSAARSA